ncbi:MAG TPA: hypothetical protein VMX35_10310 [Acidobacteriota bacterium]|nr:hypothetical protein [Acidobacteriota bacterium]
MDLPFGSIDGKRLEVRFSTADFSVATVIAGISEHLDMFEEIDVVFLGVATEVPAGPQPVFQPAEIKAHFLYDGGGDAGKALRRVYLSLWKGVMMHFPDELEWSEAKSNFADFISAQAELLRARGETS